MSNENIEHSKESRLRMGPSRGLAQRPGAGTDPARARRGGDGVPGQGEVGATVGFRQTTVVIGTGTHVPGSMTLSSGTIR